MPDTRIVDYRSVLAAKGEVKLGVFARRTRRRRILVALSGVGLTAFAVWLGWVLWPKGEASTGQIAAVHLRCMACAFETTRAVASNQRYPMLCPACKAHALRELWTCRAPNCGFAFVPDPGGVQRTCPKCGSAEVGSFVALREETETPATPPPTQP